MELYKLFELTYISCFMTVCSVLVVTSRLKLNNSSRSEYQPPERLSLAKSHLDLTFTSSHRSRPKESKTLPRASRLVSTIAQQCRFDRNPNSGLDNANDRPF